MSEGLTEVQKQALVGRGPNWMSAYYFTLDETGEPSVDLVLAAVAWAGKLAHHTESWDDNDEHWSVYGGAPIQFIQRAANDAAAEVRRLRAAVSSAALTLEEFPALVGPVVESLRAALEDQ